MRKYGFHPKLAESTDAKPTDADGPLYFLGKKKNPPVKWARTVQTPVVQG